MSIRIQGKAGFAHLQQGGRRLQIYVRLDNVGEKAFQLYKLLDLGDYIGVKGYLFRTRTNELTVHVEEITFLVKDLLPLPEKWHGLQDVETRYRRRYVDLTMNPEVREVFLKRAKVVQSMRRFLDTNGFIEVETPMMHPIPGGAVARPFITHHNALDTELYLRIAPELYLKKLVVGGLEKVFEINRNFRNEGISTRHNPEFTMLEFYEAFQDYRYLMDLTEALLREVAQKVCGATTIEYQGVPIELGTPFDRLNTVEAIRKYVPELETANLADGKMLREFLSRRGVEVSATAGLGQIHFSVFEECVESLLLQPTFVVDYPTEVSPLARASDDQPSITERFELFITGREIANGFSELNDPEDQAARFTEQAKAKEAGDAEAMHYDADYIRALEYGLPPTAGEGIGIDRVVMLLPDSPSIRDVILFPQLKKES